jgi:hypothetical protein
MQKSNLEGISYLVEELKKICLERFRPRMSPTPTSRTQGEESQKLLAPMRDRVTAIEVEKGETGHVLYAFDEAPGA